MKKHIAPLLLLFFCGQHIRSQNIGIGTNNPTRAKLEVIGVAGIGNTNAVFGGSSSGISLQQNWPTIGFNQYRDNTVGHGKYMSNGFAGIQYFDPGSGALAFDVYPSGTSNTVAASSARVFTISRDGHVGIGGATPNGYLQFDNSLANRKIVLYQATNNDYQYYGFGIESGTLRYNVDAPGAAHRFYAANNSSSSTFLMSIGGNKKVLIGQQEQGFKLGINTTDPLFTIEMVQAGNKGLGFINPLNGYHYWEMKSEVYGTGSDCLSLYYDGGTFPKGWFRPTDGGYSSTSDRRVKNNIHEMENILPLVLRLQPSRYRYNSDRSQKNCIGFIAQDVKKIFPELVDVRSFNPTGNIPDLHGVNYNMFGVIAIKAIQEQQQQLNGLQKEIELLKEQNTLLLQLLKQKTE